MGSLSEMLFVSSEGGQSIEGVEGDSGFAAGESAVARMDLMLDRTMSDPEGVEVRDGPWLDFAILGLFSATWPTPPAAADGLLCSGCFENGRVSGGSKFSLASSGSCLIIIALSLLPDMWSGCPLG